MKEKESDSPEIEDPIDPVTEIDWNVITFPDLLLEFGIPPDEVDRIIDEMNNIDETIN